MAHPSNSQLKSEWVAKLQPLVGRTIINVRYMTDMEKESVGFCHAPVVLTLDDHTLLYPVADDEGNDAGTLAIQPGQQTATLPDGAPVI